MRQRRGELDPLLVPERERLDPVLRAVGDAEDLQDTERAGAGAARPTPCSRAR